MRRDDPVSASFEELDWRPTPLGEISLRRRLEPTLRIDVYEVKLDDEFLMSSLFTAGEIALADISLASTSRADLDVVVGGLGLGYTAHAVLRHPRVRSLQVIEVLGEVIEWHQRGLLPVSHELTSDQRCNLVNGDFFAMVATGSSFGPDAPDRHDAVLVDIDHTPRHLLHPRHAPSTTLRGCGDSRIGSTQEASSPCGPTTPRTRTSSPSSKESSRHARRTSSPFRTQFPEASLQAPCTSPR